MCFFSFFFSISFLVRYAFIVKAYLVITVINIIIIFSCQHGYDEMYEVTENSYFCRIFVWLIFVRDDGNCHILPLFWKEWPLHGDFVKQPCYCCLVCFVRFCSDCFNHNNRDYLSCEVNFHHTCLSIFKDKPNYKMTRKSKNYNDILHKQLCLTVTLDVYNNVSIKLSLGTNWTVAVIYPP